MSLTVHSDSTHSPRYWVTSNNSVVFTSENGADTMQWAIDFGETSIRVDGTIEILSGNRINGSYNGILINKKLWHRICSRCNGIILKGEGQIIGKCKTDGCTTWQHKKYGLCQKFKYGE